VEKLAPSPPRLEWAETPGQPRTLSLAAERILIGRSTAADIVLSHRLASRQHAHVCREGEGWVLVDLQSTHGTFVNGDRVDRRPLRNRDVICLGPEGVKIVFLESRPNETADTGNSLLESAGLDYSVRKLASVIPDNADAHSELEKVSYLLDFHYSFGKAFSPEKTFHQILKSALQISGAERGFVMRKQKGGFSYALGLDSLDKTLSEADFKTSHSVVEQVARTGRPVFMTQGIEGDLAAQASIVAMNLRAVACLPLEVISHESATAGVMGIVYLDSRKYMHSLSGLDERLLTRLAGDAGRVLEKLELLETLAERKKIEQELAVAEETQRTLLPHQLPQFAPYRIRAFCRPTRQLGGDFYDFIPIGDRMIGVLGDVAGKGIPAALLSSLTLGALNMEFRSSADPAAVLNSLNQLLCQKTPSDRFVTLFLIDVDSSGKGQYISAGHNTAWLFRSQTRRLDDLPSCGLPLGILPVASYQASSVEIGPGDILVIYSDGLTDAENPKGDELGEKKIRDLICATGPRGAEALENELLATLDRFTLGSAQTDDITFLLIQNFQPSGN
jgi:phosphoserine phosphatase RsbU/P